MYLDTVKLFYLRSRMPRVVLDQRGKFNNDELFTNLSRQNEVKYVDLPSGSEEERRHKFLQDCNEGHIDIAFSSSGFNLELHISAGNGQEQSFTSDKVDLESEPPKVHICSHFILNGVCVRWKGWIDRTTLKGNGWIEFDEERANIEEQRLRQELASLDERFRINVDQRITTVAHPIINTGEASSSTALCPSSTTSTSSSSTNIDSRRI